MEVIEELRRDFALAPECREEEVTNAAAVRMLAPQIYEMRSKGYSLVAIANLLSQRGIDISTVTLQSYLRSAKSKRARPSKHKAAKGGRDASGASLTGRRDASGASLAAAGTRLEEGDSDDCADALRGAPDPGERTSPRPTRAPAG